MKRDKLEEYLGEMIEVTLFDGDTYRGCLRKTRDEAFKNDASLFLPLKRYFMTDCKESKKCTSCLFRSSHVTKIKKI